MNLLNELTIEVKGSNLLFESPVYFAALLASIGPDVGVLGLRNFATRLRIGLVHYERVLYLADYNAP